MATLEEIRPNFTPKSLIRRANRDSRMIAFTRAAFVSSSLAGLERMARLLAKSFRNAEPKLQCEIARTYIAVREQERILLRIPGPGRMKDEGMKPVLDGQIQVSNGQHDHVLERELQEIRSIQSDIVHPDPTGPTSPDPSTPVPPA